MSKKQELKKLSASRIDTLINCSWSYYCNYILKLPDLGNPGSKRGSIIHDFFECLATNVDRHKWKYDEIRKFKNTYTVKCVKRFIEIKAKKYNLNLDDLVVTKNGAGLISNRDYINEMVLVGLDDEFYGKEGHKIIAEELHVLDVDRPEENIRYIAQGYLDKQFLKENKENEVEEAEIVDYKSSKRKFSKDKIKYNMQGMLYQLFMRKAYPKLKKLKMNFLFLQFPRGKWQSVAPVKRNLIKGIEVYLTHLFKKINNFTEEDGKTNFAKHNGLAPFCGKDGYKFYKDKELGKIESPEPNWKCPYKDPYDYFALLDENGDVKKTSLTEGELQPKKGEKVEKKRYGGCLAWHPNGENDKSFGYS